MIKNYLLMFVVIFSLNANKVLAADNNKQPLLIPSVKINADHEVTTGDATTANVTIITSTQIKQMGAVNLAQVLRHYAGLQVQDLYGDGTQVQLSMSGFGDNSLSNVKVLIDGVPINNPDLSSLNFNRIAVEDIDHIEIFTGSSAILFGDGAVGGVIDIITKKSGKFSGHINGAAGSYNQRIASANVTDTLGNWHYYINGQQKYSNGFRDHNKNDTGNFDSQIGYNTNKGSVILHVQQIDAHAQYPGSLTEQQWQSDPTQLGSGYGNYNNIDRITEIFFKHYFNDHWRLSGRMSTRSTNGYGEFFSGFDQQQRVHTGNPELTSMYQISTGKIITTSGIFLEKDLYETSYINTQDQRNVEAVYSQINLPISKQWQLLAGARYAQADSNFEGNTINNEVKNHALVNSIGLSWQATKNFRWYVNRSGNYRFPKLDEAESMAPGASPLKTQIGVNYQTGADYQWQNLDSRVDIYQLDLDHEIAYDPTPIPGEPFGINTNLDPTRRRGFMWTESLQALTNWQLGAQYAYVDGKFSSGNFLGNRIPLVAKNKLTAFSILAFAKNWSWYIADIFVGNRYPGSDNANQQTTLPSTMVVNTNLGYHINNWRIAFRVDNITNKQYVESAFVNTINKVGYYPAPGRNFLFNIDYEF